jgi:hypothetical protein
LPATATCGGVFVDGFRLLFAFRIAGRAGIDCLRHLNTPGASPSANLSTTIFRNTGKRVQIHRIRYTWVLPAIYGFLNAAVLCMLAILPLQHGSELLPFVVLGLPASILAVPCFLSGDAAALAIGSFLLGLGQYVLIGHFVDRWRVHRKGSVADQIHEALHMRRPASNKCRQCGYALSESPGPLCPECGSQIAPDVTE